ncbi:MAG: efflux RND transporter periplasmic adaptor subunit [Desulfobacteraceae bacterium]|nr:efflux RND transporter periplasmic adaptor subunit [Desulfobacteraceae bacterium]
MKLKDTFILLLAILPLTACGGAIEPGNTAPGAGQTIQAPVAEAHVSQEPFLYEAVATINARTASTISAKLMGAVQSVNVQEGDMVKKGDLLVTIDPRTVSAQLDQAEAGLREAGRAQTSAISSRDAAKAAADLAVATYKRYQELLKENSVSKQEYDEVESRSRQAQAALAQAEAMVEASHSRVQQAQAAVEQATLAKRDAHVNAPYDGLVVAKLVAQGDLASPGTPLLTIEQEGLFCADLVLPERYIQSISIGQPVKVKVPALNDLEATGNVGRIVPAADTQSRSFEIKVAMPEGLELKSGMFARVFIPVGGAGIMLLPETAVKSEGQLTGVYIVDEKQIAHFRLVRTGKSYGDRIEIISGLSDGQRYVPAIPVTLKDGMKVEAAQ